MIDLRLMPSRIEDVWPGVWMTPPETTKMFSPEPSQTCPRSSSRIASSYPDLCDSIFARTELRYWPEALACGISESGEMRRHEETLARMPRRLPSSPR